MNQLEYRQKEFVEDMEGICDWSFKFDVIIDYGNDQPSDCPARLSDCRIINCASRTYFKAYLVEETIRIDGWSNSAVMGGVVGVFAKIFNGISAEEISGTPIDFHTKSGLMDNVTTLRRVAIEEMLQRVIVLAKKEKSPEI